MILSPYFFTVAAIWLTLFNQMGSMTLGLLGIFAF